MNRSDESSPGVPTDTDEQLSVRDRKDADDHRDSTLRPLVAPSTYGDRVAEILRDKVIDGSLPRGERLVEAEIARQLGISRGPVREALSQLRGEGLVREERGRGAYVVSLSAHDVANVFGVRAALESYAVRMIASERNEEALAELTEFADGIKEAAQAGDAKLVGALDWQFHDLLCSASGNERLHAFFTTHATLLRAMIAKADRIFETYYKDLNEISDEHAALVAALRKGDISEAETLCRDHLERAMAHIVEQMAVEETRSEPLASEGER